MSATPGIPPQQSTVTNTLQHQLSDGPLPFGEITLGQREYREFACSKSTARWLSNGAMTRVDGQEVTLQIVEEFPGGHNVMVRFWTRDEA